MSCHPVVLNDKIAVIFHLELVFRHSDKNDLDSTILLFFIGLSTQNSISNKS